VRLVFLVAVRPAAVSNIFVGSRISTRTLRSPFLRQALLDATTSRLSKTSGRSALSGWLREAAP